jgi:SAM-dependent methyltransferase
MILLLLGILIGCFLGISWFAGSDAPYVATKLKFIKKILTDSGLKKSKIFYELGSGDGRVVLEAAKLGAKAYGIEQSWMRVWYSRFKARKLNLPNATFYHGDIFQRTYFSADFVFIFLLPKGVEKLEPKLKKELKKGAIVITQTFHFPNWKPIKKISLSKKEKANFLGPNKYAGDFWIYKKS